jgi:hypothetical protein
MNFIWREPRFLVCLQPRRVREKSQKQAKKEKGAR